jgi:hypothetical protein
VRNERGLRRRVRGVIRRCHGYRSISGQASKWCGRQGSNLRRLAFQASARPPELRPRDGRGWSRTSDLVFVRQVLSRLSYSPASSGTRIEPRSPRSERGVLPLRRSRNAASPSISGSEIDATAAPLSRSAPAERCCPSHSPTLRPWTAVHPVHKSERTPSYVEEPWSPTSHARSTKMAR